MGYFPRRKQNVTRDDIVIRKEDPSEYHQTEKMTLRAFWNKYHLGCNEHLLVHKLRKSDVYLPELSRVAVAGDEIVGAICYSRAWLKCVEKDRTEKVKEILTFGPLCVAPEWQGCGVGGLLLEETLVLAKESGYEGVVIFGEPEYYPRHGFQTCDHFGITTADGKNFDAFMGIELVEGGLANFGGKFYESEIFEDLPEAENEEFTKKFDAPVKRKFPCQWD
ncbi:MAG: N-acetyltransferase [Lachnospiraceae bacterium]|nr:N-acetyltransferase [Lachnospiraceae bacterium]